MSYRVLDIQLHICDDEDNNCLKKNQVHLYSSILSNPDRRRISITPTVSIHHLLWHLMMLAKLNNLRGQMQRCLK